MYLYSWDWLGKGRNSAHLDLLPKDLKLLVYFSITF